MLYELGVFMRLSESRVVVFEGFSQELAVHMGVNLGGGNACMTEHFLDCSEIGAAFNQVCGKRMSEAMGRYGLSDSRLSDQVFEDQENHHAGQAGTSLVEENDVFMPALSGKVYS